MSRCGFFCSGFGICGTHVLERGNALTEREREAGGKKKLKGEEGWRGEGEYK